MCEVGPAATRIAAQVRPLAPMRHIGGSLWLPAVRGAPAARRMPWEDKHVGASHMPAPWAPKTHACAADGADLLAGSTHSHGTHGLAAELAGAEGHGLGRNSGGSNHSSSHHFDRHRWHNVWEGAGGPRKAAGEAALESRRAMSLAGCSMPIAYCYDPMEQSARPWGRCGTAIAAEPHVSHGL